MGLTAIRYGIEGRFETAVTAVMAAAVLDGLDGRLARALKGTSRFGAELDSLSDFVDFGVAPGLLLYLWTLQEIKGLGWFAVLVFAIAGALRLARFNVTIDDPTKPAWQAEFFVGMPAPAGARDGAVAALSAFLGFGAAGLQGDDAVLHRLCARHRLSDGEPHSAFLRQAHRPHTARSGHSRCFSASA